MILNIRYQEDHYWGNLAERAYTLNYTCPTFIDKPGIRITEGRHPVVEQVLNEPFIANPLNLSPQRRMLIITGPNMGGKSTYMRQTALIALMAYITNPDSYASLWHRKTVREAERADSR